MPNELQNPLDAAGKPETLVEDQRLMHLQPWVNQLATPEMYAGVETQGAEDAAYHTALMAELCKLTDTQFSEGATNIFKYFD